MGKDIQDILATLPSVEEVARIVLVQINVHRMRYRLAAIPLANRDPVGKQLIVCDVETIDATTPRKGRLFHRIALVERNRRFTVSPGEIGIMGFSDLGHDILFRPQKRLALAHQLLEQWNVHCDLIDHLIAQKIIQKSPACDLQVCRRNRHLSLHMKENTPFPSLEKAPSHRYRTQHLFFVKSIPDATPATAICHELHSALSGRDPGR